MTIRSALLGLALALISGQAALASECQALWYERNAVYKAAGYCFKTSRAIAAFGNAGCQYDSEYELPLSAAQRRRVAYLQSQERALGCR